MTLRTRLLGGVFGVAIVLALVGIFVAVTQRNHFYDQLDRQPEAIEDVISQVADRPPVERPGDSDSIVGNAYIGVVLPAGTRSGSSIGVAIGIRLPSGETTPM